VTTIRATPTGGDGTAIHGVPGATASLAPFAARVAPGQARGMAAAHRPIDPGRGPRPSRRDGGASRAAGPRSGAAPWPGTSMATVRGAAGTQASPGQPRALGAARPERGAGLGHRRRDPPGGDDPRVTRTVPVPFGAARAERGTRPGIDSGPPGGHNPRVTRTVPVHWDCAGRAWTPPSGIDDGFPGGGHGIRVTPRTAVLSSENAEAAGPLREDVTGGNVDRMLTFGRFYRRSVHATLGVHPRRGSGRADSQGRMDRTIGLAAED
jgi:hypothetical protein